MPNLSKITLPTGISYNIKDIEAHEDIAELRNAISGGITFKGTTTTPLTDGATTNPITINEQSITALRGYLVIYQNKEFVFDSIKWFELGDLSLIGNLGWKDSASGTITPSGTVSQPTFTGASETITVNGTPSGSISTPTITVTPTTSIVNSITEVGTLPSLTTTVDNEILTIGWNTGTLPTKGTNTTVLTGIESSTSTQPIFTGSEMTSIGTYQPTGTITQPTFSGNEVIVIVT